MYTGILHLHRFIAYIALILLFIATLKFLFGFLNKKSFTEGDKKLGLFTLISSHLQLLLGLALFFTGSTFDQLSSMSAVMKNPDLRFLVIEHPLTMLLGVVLITVGYSTAKRTKNDRDKFKRLSLYFLLGLGLILSRVPWEKLA